MPHFLNDIVVVTKDEIVPRWYKLKTLQQNIHRYASKDYGIKRVERGGNGNQLLVLFDSLPTHIKTALGDPRKGKHPLEKFYRMDGEAILFYENYIFKDGSKLDFEHVDKYALNASMLKALVALKEAREAGRTVLGMSLRGHPESNGIGLLNSVMLSLCLDAKSFNKILKEKHNIEHSLPENERRFKDVFKNFGANGYESLISGKHRNKYAKKEKQDTNG